MLSTRILAKALTVPERIRRIPIKGDKRIYFPYRGDLVHPMFRGLRDYPPLPYVNLGRARLAHWLQGPRSMGLPFVVEPIDHPLSPSRVSGPEANLANRDAVASIYLSDLCKRIILVSSGQHKLLERYFPEPSILEKAVVIPPSMPPPKEREAAVADLGIPEKQGTTFCCIASHYVTKGVTFLIEAWERFHSGHPDSRLLLVSHDYPSTTPPKGCRLVRNIPLSHRERISLLTQSDVFLFLTLTDGISAIEALSYSLPIITYRSQHSSDFVANNNGIEVPVPINIYDEGYGHEWKNITDYEHAIDNHAKNGDFSRTVEGLYCALCRYHTDREFLATHASRSAELYWRRYSPTVRNRDLLNVYSDAYPDCAHNR